MKQAKRLKSNRRLTECDSYFEHHFLCSVQLYLETSHVYISPYTFTSMQARSMPPHEHPHTLSKALFDVNDCLFWDLRLWRSTEDVEKASRWCRVVLETYKWQLVPCWWLKSALSLKTTGNCSAKWICDCAHNPPLGFPLRYYPYLMVVLRRRTEWLCSHAVYQHGCTGVWAVQLCVLFFFIVALIHWDDWRRLQWLQKKSTTLFFFFFQVQKTHQSRNFNLLSCYSRRKSYLLPWLMWLIEGK